MGNTTARNQGSSVVPRIADFRVLVVPGLDGSGPEHWQSRWQRLYPAFERVEQDRWDVADLPVWSSRLQEVLAQDARPTVIVAHSFGCLTTVHRVGLDAGHIVGALLVAPADPEKFKVADIVQVRLPFPSVVIGSTDDPWMSAERAEHWAGVWGSEFVNAGAVGHINTASGLGDWPDGQDVLAAVVKRVGNRNSVASA
jgi:predicted alpha/beta hydrolase family esterase